MVLDVGAQPTIAWLARLAASLQRVPYIVSITDLAAQAARDVGITTEGRLSDALERIEYGAYRQAQAAIVLCEAFKTALVQNGFPTEAVHLIRDSVDLNMIRPGSDGSVFKRRHGIGETEFVVLYAGSLGLKQGLFDVVNAARHVRANYPPVRWVLVGEGEMRAELARRVRSAGVEDQVLMLPLPQEAEMPGMSAAADSLLLSQWRLSRILFFHRSCSCTWRPVAPSWLPSTHEARPLTSSAMLMAESLCQRKTRDRWLKRSRQLRPTDRRSRLWRDGIVLMRNCTLTVPRLYRRSSA